MLKNCKLAKISLCFFLFIALFFNPLFLGGKTLSFADNFSLNTPLLSFYFNKLKQGKMVFWNPHLFSGAPLIGDQNLGLFYPVNFLFAVASPFWALNGVIILDFLIAGLGMYYLLKSFSLDGLSCFAGGLIFIFSDSFLKHANNLPLISASSLLPWVVLSLNYVIRKKNIASLILTALLLTLQIAAGHIQIQIYTLIFIIGFLIFSLKITAKKKIKILLLLLGFGLALASFLLLPFLENVFLSSRRAFLLSELKTRSLSLSMLIGIILPNFFSEAQKGISWGPAWRWILPLNGYSGIIPLVLVTSFFILNKKKKRRENFFFYSCLASLILALGPNTFVFSLVYHFLPGFKYLRSPTYILTIYNFSLAVLTAIAFNWFSRKLDFVKIKSKNQKRLFLYLPLFALFLIFSLGLTIQLGFSFFYNLADKVYPQVQQLLRLGSFHNFARDQAILSNVWEGVIICLGVLCLLFILFFLIRVKKISLSFFRGAIIFLMLADLFYYSRSILFFIPLKSMNKGSPAAEYIKQDKTVFRYLTSGDFSPYTGLISYWENMVFQPPFADSIFAKEERQSFNILAKRKSLLVSNWGVVEGLSTVSGYGSMINKAYGRFFEKDQAKINPTLINAVDYTDPRLNFLNVKYIIADKEFPQVAAVLQKNPQFSLVYADKNAKIFKNKDAWPRASLIDEGGNFIQAAEILDYQTEKIEVFADIKEPARLVLSEVYHPGWQVYLDARKGEILKYKNVFRSVVVPKGETEVTFIYKPKLFDIGLKISLFALVLGGGLIWREKKKKFSL